MKLKVFSVLFVFVLCCTLFVFTSNSNAEPRNEHKDISLIKKIDEIENVLEMNLWREDAEQIELEGFFQKYKSNKPAKFKFKKPNVTEPITDPAQIAAYLFANKDNIKKIKRTKVEYEDVDVQEPVEDWEIDATATVTIKFEGNSFGEVTFLLRHMRRCEWD